MTAADNRADPTEALRKIPALSKSRTVADSIERGDGGVGQATLDLRGMGSNRALIVVTGRRHVAGVAGERTMDASTKPVALIERVDVLTGDARSSDVVHSVTTT